jgi:beta-lactamase superfamily II metal-dependent hydrolase
MKVQIFDVEHGGCALVTADTGARMLIDCGHNASTGWRPSSYLPGIGVTHLGELVITNYDEDHVSDLPNLVRSVGIGHLTRNPTVSGAHLRDLKSETGAGPGIECLIRMTAGYTSAVVSPPNYGAMTYSLFWNRYPIDFDDENNLSLVLFLHCHRLHMVFPGDLEAAGWRALLRNPNFVQELQRVNVFVASHHGRASGCCDEVFNQANCSPEIVVFSDAGIQYSTQTTAGWYGSRCRGMIYNGVNRYVFSTRQDGRLLFEATPTTTTVQTLV